MNTSTVRAVTSKIKHQFGHSPEDLLMFKIVERAIYDASIKDSNSTVDMINKRSAISYLSSNVIPHCELSGVDSEWVHRVLSKVGIIGAR